MAYPRVCEACGVCYPSQSIAETLTLSAQDGGTPSPWVPDKPGRILDIGCKACGAVFQWDYFAQASDGRLGVVVAHLRPSVEGWQLGDSFRLGRGCPAVLVERRAS